MAEIKPIRRALFLDRDGIFNEVVYRDGPNGKFLSSPRDWSEIRHFEGLDELPKLKELGFRLILVTNQPDIERGLVELEFIEQLHSFYRKKYELDAVFCCPFSDNEHPLKKPNPGMFLKAAEDFSLSLPDSFHLGDTDRDVRAAARSGCQSILWDRPYNRGLRAHFRISHLWEVRALLATEPRP